MVSEANAFWTEAFWCCFYGGGIIGCLVAYGLLQEKIMDQPYSGGAIFGYSAFLVMWNRFFAVAFAASMAGVKQESFKPAAPLWKFLAVSLSNVFASMCQYEALKYVSFPVQMLGKSFKMLPVMCWGIAIAGKAYGFSEWMIAACITGGVTEFLLTGSISSSHNAGTSWKGLVLLLVFLLLDGFTSTFQEKLFKDHKTTKYNQMMYINSFSMLVSFITLCVTRSLIPSFTFAGEHPALIGDAVLLSIAAVAGQWFIYSQVKEFGALVFAATMNVRQIVSILVSYITYGHPITGLQVLGLVLVFGALFYKSAVGFLYPAKREAKEKEEIKGTSGETADTKPVDTIKRLEAGDYGATGTANAKP